jgi:hypothetical protein
MSRGNPLKIYPYAKRNNVGAIAHVLRWIGIFFIGEYFSERRAFISKQMDGMVIQRP